MSEKYWRLVIYAKGKRIEKKVLRTPANTAALVAKVKQLKEKDVKCRLVGLTDRRKYPPARQIAQAMDEGKGWCPYCGDWSYFKVPKYTPDAMLGSDAWFNNAFFNQDIRVCSWCGISEFDFYVVRANHSFSETHARKRKRRNKRTRRPRARAR